jgi:hypothetical protein
VTATVEAEAIGWWWWWEGGGLCARLRSMQPVVLARILPLIANRQDFIRIPSSGCNQNRAGSRGMPRDPGKHPLQPPPPAPAGPRPSGRGYGLPATGGARSQARAGQRNTTGESERAESRERVAIFKRCSTRRLGTRTRLSL